MFICTTLSVKDKHHGKITEDENPFQKDGVLIKLNGDVTESFNSTNLRYQSSSFIKDVKDNIIILRVVLG